MSLAFSGTKAFAMVIDYFCGPRYLENCLLSRKEVFSSVIDCPCFRWRQCLKNCLLLIPSLILETEWVIEYERPVLHGPKQSLRILDHEREYLPCLPSTLCPAKAKGLRSPVVAAVAPL